MKIAVGPVLKHGDTMERKTRNPCKNIAVVTIVQKTCGYQKYKLIIFLKPFVFKKCAIKAAEDMGKGLTRQLW